MQPGHLFQDSVMGTKTRVESLLLTCLEDLGACKYSYNWGGGGEGCTLNLRVALQVRYM